jgi:hypothetical protein
MVYVANVFYKCWKVFVYKILRKLVRQMTSNLKMKKRIAIVKKINLCLYAPWLNIRKNIYQENIYQLNELDLTDGYFQADASNIPFVEDAINDCKDILTSTEKRVRKTYLVNHLDYEKLPGYKGLLRFCTSPLLVGTAAKYLGEFPVISGIEVWNSPPSVLNKTELTGSQKFHLDNVDNRQLKVFLNLSDVSDDNGPFSFISASDSKKVLTELKYGQAKNVERLEDDGVYALVNRSNLKQNIGPSGFVTGIDTCQCLHYGSRNCTQGRQLLMVQFTSVARADSRPFEVMHASESYGSEYLNLLFNPFYMPGK